MSETVTVPVSPDMDPCDACFLLNGFESPFLVVRFSGEAGECYTIQDAKRRVVIPDAGDARTALGIAATFNAYERLFGIARRMAQVLQYSWLATDWSKMSLAPVEEYHKLLDTLRDAKEKLGEIGRMGVRP